MIFEFFLMYLIDIFLRIIALLLIYTIMSLQTRILSIFRDIYVERIAERYNIIHSKEDLKHLSENTEKGLTSLPAKDAYSSTPVLDCADNDNVISKMETRSRGCKQEKVKARKDNKGEIKCKPIQRNDHGQFSTHKKSKCVEGSTKNGQSRNEKHASKDVEISKRNLSINHAIGIIYPQKNREKNRKNSFEHKITTVEKRPCLKTNMYTHEANDTLLETNSKSSVNKSKVMCNHLGRTRKIREENKLDSDKKCELDVKCTSNLHKSNKMTALIQGKLSLTKRNENLKKRGRGRPRKIPITINDKQKKLHKDSKMETLSVSKLIPGFFNDETLFNNSMDHYEVTGRSVDSDGQIKYFVEYKLDYLYSMSEKLNELFN